MNLDFKKGAIEMSLFVHVGGCKPSVLASAFARLFSGRMEQGGWAELDQNDFLVRGFSDVSRKALREGAEAEYESLCRDSANWEKVLRALPGSPEERWKVDARQFAVARRKECRDRIRQIEACEGFNPPLWDLIPRQFGEKRLAYPVFIPGGCMRICLKEHPAFLDLLPLPWVTDVSYIGLRYASHGEASQFLRILAQKTQIRLMGADKCRCEVAREGTRVSIPESRGLVGGGTPEHCLELLEKESGREVAKSEFPPYDKQGQVIPE